MALKTREKGETRESYRPSHDTHRRSGPERSGGMGPIGWLAIVIAGAVATYFGYEGVKDLVGHTAHLLPPTHTGYPAGGPGYPGPQPRNIV